MYLLLVAIAFIVVVELLVMFTKKHSLKTKSKRKVNRPKIHSTYAYFFIAVALLSLYTIWVYILHGNLFGGPHFIFGFFIGIPIYVIVFGIMAHAARAIIKNIYFDRRLFIATIAIAVISVLISINEIVVAYTTGYLYR